MPRVLFVVPAYNEQGALPAVVAELKAEIASSGLDGEIVVVDDGSGDRTSEVAYGAGARVLRLCRNLGIGGAVQAGLRAALRERFDCAVQVDGDGQHPATEVRKLLTALATIPVPDIVVGTRFGGDVDGFKSTALRRFGSAWLRLLLRVVARLRISDPTSGYRLYGPRALELFEQTYPYDYPEPESLAMAAAARLRVVEVPVVMRERQHGQSSILGLYAPYYMLKTSLAVVLSYLRNRRPEPKGKP
ncbi:MAG: glycosyl transferase family 2 [bacterium]|nr:glycosyl transferase family 2 [bacterium]